MNIFFSNIKKNDHDIMILKKIDNLSLKSKHAFLAKFSNDLNKFNKLNVQKESRKEKTQMYMIELQIYIMIF